jgi:LPXTG-site transpeptidase (sortase) family protein
LFSFYVYAEYDRDKNADISEDILANMQISNEDDDTTINALDDVWVIALDGGDVSQDVYSANAEEEASSSSSATTSGLNGTYTASNGRVYNTVGTINIPSIEVNYPILSETSDDLLKVSVCKFWGSDPNEVGNLCIAGHNYRNSKFFSKVLKLVVGDTIEITDLTGRTLTYAIYDKYTVDPTDVSCTSQITNGKKIVTLITCTNDSKQRVVLKAEEV